MGAGVMTYPVAFHQISVVDRLMSTYYVQGTGVNLDLCYIRLTTVL